MKRPVSSSARAGCARGCPRRGYTIVELLMATSLTLILLFVVVTIFAMVSDSINDARATLEMTDRLRAAEMRLQSDFAGLTVPVDPPRRPGAGEGYLEYQEGGVGPVSPPSMIAFNSDTGQEDTTVSDFDDILMFTVRSRDAPFVGRYRDTTIQSNEAEVIWFVRGRTLYRRVLLIAPQVMSDIDDNHDGVADATDGNGVVDLVDTGGQSFYALYDLSARPEEVTDDSGSTTAGWVLNTLGDLTKRENRYAHRVHPRDEMAFPWQIARWGQIGLPTLCECSSMEEDSNDNGVLNPGEDANGNGVLDRQWMGWANPASRPGVTPESTIDLWNKPHPWAYVTATRPAPEVDAVTGTLLGYEGPRIGEILTNVIGFDVKIWDPNAPIFQAVGDNPLNPTPTDLTDDVLVGGVLVTQGNPGYPLALAHYVEDPANVSFRPVARGAYVDLHYSAYAAATYHGGDPAYVAVYNRISKFSGPADPRSGLTRVYDTWSFHYEHDGLDQDGDGTVDEGTNGFDDDGDGVVDDAEDVDVDGDGVFTGPEWAETETRPPYPTAARGLQIKIRTFEPDSRQVREVTVIADFSPK